MLPGRLMAILFSLTGLLLAQPSVTTIQDTIYKADGSRFDGTAVINWITFDASDASNIGQQSLSVPIVNGAFYVQLVPNNNAHPTNVYTVHYNSAGLEQFTETWSVPASTVTLRVRDVRVDPNAPGGPGGTTGPASIAETQVTGLSADLILRPIKGSGFSPGRTAVVNDAGEIESVAGNPSDCVRVNGTAATCFDTASLASFVDAETPTGVIDSLNTSFTLVNAPLPSTSLQLYRNGVYQTAGIDFTVSGNNIQFLPGAIPQPGDLLLASYRVGGLRTTTTQQITTAFPLTGGGPLANNPALALADAAFLRRGHKAMVLGDSFAGVGASWAIPGNWFAQATVQFRSVIRYAGNAGVAADTVAGMLARVNADVISKTPDKVFIAAGSTDIAAGTAPTAVTATVSAIVALLKAANILPILCSIPPVQQFVSATTQYNLQLQHLADLQGIPFVDVSAQLVDSTTGRIKAAYGADISNLAGSANRFMATAVNSAVAALFDQTPPWIPTSDLDGVNLIVDGLFQASPSRWTASLVSGSVPLPASIGSDYTISGNTAALSKTDRASVNALRGVAITTGFQPGDRIAFTGRIKTSGVEFGGLAFDAGLQFSPGINMFYPMFHWSADIRDGQWYAETVVPAGVTSITPFFLLNQGIGTVVVGQVGLINLTVLGL